LQTSFFPVLETPFAPSVEQNAPGVTIGTPLNLTVALVEAVDFGAAVVVALLVVGAAGTVDAGAVLVGGTVTNAVVAGAVVAALEVAVALMVWAAELALALANGTFGVDGAAVNGFAMAPTAPRLRTPPATTPILTLPLSAFHCPARRAVSLVVGIRCGRRGGCGLFMLGGWVMRSLHLGCCSNTDQGLRGRA